MDGRNTDGQHVDERWISNPTAGARNLLENCVGLTAGETVLLVCENSRYGHYDRAVGDLVGKVAEDMGATVFEIDISPIQGPEDFPDMVGAAMEKADHAVFFSQAGDQVRFCKTPGKATKTMTYTLDLDLLGSPFGTVHHGLMGEMVDLLRHTWAKGGEWRVTCPMGTDLTGQLEPHSVTDKEQNAFSVNLFPNGILPPVGAATMTGRAATRCVMATQNRRYDPDGLVLDDTAYIDIADGRITGFDGAAADTVSAHYDHVAKLFDIDRSFVHSWHTGHHPKAHYHAPMTDDLVRWGTVTFNSPRYTHIHTCGDYPPGEIAIIIIDATITLNGEVLWDAGRFAFTDRPEVQALLAKYPGNDDAFEMLWDIGLGDVWDKAS